MTAKELIKIIGDALRDMGIDDAPILICHGDAARAAVHVTGASLRGHNALMIGDVESNAVVAVLMADQAIEKARGK